MQTVKILPLLALLCLAVGCSPYSMEEVRIAFEGGDFDAALIELDADGKGEAKLPYLFERGLIAHYGDKFDESNRTFELAEITADDLYTKSISREAVSLLTSDNLRSYAGSQYERLLIHYYRAFNYVYLNMPDDALVECRKASGLLQFYADADENYKFVGAAFIAYLSGILYEWAGDWNDAFIAYRWAERAYKQYGPLGVPFPQDVGESLVRLAGKLGFQEEFERYATIYGEPPENIPDSGELILLYETGFAPFKTEENIVFPILKVDPIVQDDADRDEKEVREYSRTLMSRRNRRYKEVEIEYLLRVAIPAYRSNRPRIVGIDASTAHGGASGVLVEDIEAAAMKTFESELPTIMLRTVVRGVLKYLGFRRANQEGKIAGRLVNLLNVVTESADTRSWQTLPNQIFLVRMCLPAGTHNITLSFSDRANRRVKTDTLQDVVIRKNDKTFLNYRTFE
jgi:hypothetical protein